MKNRKPRLLTAGLALTLALSTGGSMAVAASDTPDREMFADKAAEKIKSIHADSAASESDQLDTGESAETTETENAEQPETDDSDQSETAGSEQEEADAAETESAEQEDPEPEGQEEPAPKGTTSELTEEAVAALRKANDLVVQYSYGKAIAELKAVENYSDFIQINEAIKSYQKMRDACVEYPLEEITHIFFHTLIYDTSKAFDDDYTAAGYNQVMTTIKEFRKILKYLYKRGYVLVSPHDMAKVNEDGTMSRGRILLPEGKKPLVLSQDDVSYYHYMDGDGFASRLVLDENGEVKCEYIEDDGSVSTGDYDLVPILDAFVKEHPDFSYHGRKGILAMTGYNGVLGYRTDAAYRTGEELDENQIDFLNAHPDFDFDEEVRQARAVADAMKANGWEFASHTWGHRNATTSSAAELREDNERYENSVVPVLGKTDMIIFAFGADIGNWDEYSWDNPKFAYYKSAGYNYYCNVDSSRYWVQITPDFFRQGRRNLDGYRMYYNPEMLSDLFNVKKVWDKSRPTPVEPMG